MASSVTHLSFREKFSYGLGDFASNLYWQTFMLYMTYFYTDIFGLAAAATATMFLVNRIVDAITDPVMGMVADHTTTRWGRFRPWLLWTCVPFAIMGVLAFTTPSFGSGGKLAWAYGTFFGMMLVYTIINIPYTALMGVIFGNSEDRTSISSFKFMFAFGAGLVVSATLLPMVRLLGAGNEA
jgi:GPH family glycoside/pentoside/hexuronide:cation symporter